MHMVELRWIPLAALSRAAEQADNAAADSPAAPGACPISA